MSNELEGLHIKNYLQRATNRLLMLAWVFALLAVGLMVKSAFENEVVNAISDMVFAVIFLFWFFGCAAIWFVIDPEGIKRKKKRSRDQKNGT